MKKDQYEEDFEQQRKEIIVDEESKEIPSRTEVHQSKKKGKKNRTKLINIILAVFTLIPIVILIYVLSDLYSPSVPNQVPVEKTKVSISKNESAEGNAVAKEEPKEDDTKKPAVVVSPEKPVEQQKKPAEKPADPPKKEPVQKQPAPKPVQKPAPKPVEQPVKKPVQGARSHVVKSNETLYRISVNYYGDGSHVQKIQQANGLSSSEISVGQTLVLP